MPHIQRIVHYIEAKAQDVVEALRPYKDDPAAFISFVEVPKLGINPSYSYDTPVAIYAYPLRELWEEFEEDTVPFAGDRPFVAFFRVPPQAGVIDMRRYDARRFERDTRFLDDYLAKLLVGRETWKIFDRAADVFSLHGAGHVSPYALYEREDLNGHVLDEADARKTVDLARTMAFRKTKRRSNMGRTWNYSRLIARLEAILRPGEARASAVWTNILRAMGYQGIVDRVGDGLIHENEPKQAFFFSRALMRDVRILPNTRPLRGLEQTRDVQEMTSLWAWRDELYLMGATPEQKFIFQTDLPNILAGRPTFFRWAVAPSTTSTSTSRDGRVIGDTVTEVSLAVRVALASSRSGGRYARRGWIFCLRMMPLLRRPGEFHAALQTLTQPGVSIEILVGEVARREITEMAAYIIGYTYVGTPTSGTEVAAVMRAALDEQKRNTGGAEIRWAVRASYMRDAAAKQIAGRLMTGAQARELQAAQFDMDLVRNRLEDTLRNKWLMGAAERVLEEKG